MAFDANSAPYSTVAGSAPAAQSSSSLGYLLIYVWAILIVVAVILILHFYVFTSPTPQSAPCTFTTGIYCQDFVLNSNSLASTIGVLLKNTYPYPISSPRLLINTSNMSAVGTCTPTFAEPGAGIVCNVTIPERSFPAGTVVTGTLLLSTILCQGGNSTSCTGGQQQNATGVFTIHVSSSNVTAPTSISLSVENKTQTATGTPDQLIATVTVLGSPVSGATVSFSQSGKFAFINPMAVETGSDGEAITYISSPTAGNTTVTATFQNVSAQANITFTTPTTLNIQSGPQGSPTCTTQDTVLTINSHSYSCHQFPLQLMFAQGSTYEYSFTPTIPPSPDGSGVQNLFQSATGCGITGQSGTLLVPNTDCTITFDYLTQYYLNESANPPGGGLVSPGSEWLNSGSSTTISASPNPGSTFVSWEGTGSTSYTGNQTTAAITASTPITEVATFYGLTTTSSLTTTTASTTTINSTTQCAAIPSSMGCVTNLLACKDIGGTACPIDSYGCTSSCCCLVTTSTSSTSTSSTSTSSTASTTTSSTSISTTSPTSSTSVTTTTSSISTSTTSSTSISTTSPTSSSSVTTTTSRSTTTSSLSTTSSSRSTTSSISTTTASTTTTIPAAIAQWESQDVSGGANSIVFAHPTAAGNTIVVGYSVVSDASPGDGACIVAGSVEVHDSYGNSYTTVFLHGEDYDPGSGSGENSRCAGAYIFYANNVNSQAPAEGSVDVIYIISKNSDADVGDVLSGEAAIYDLSPGAEPESYPSDYGGTGSGGVFYAISSSSSPLTYQQNTVLIAAASEYTGGVCCASYEDPTSYQNSYSSGTYDGGESTTYTGASQGSTYFQMSNGNPPVAGNVYTWAVLGMCLASTSSCST